MYKIEKLNFLGNIFIQNQGKLILSNKSISKDKKEILLYEKNNQNDFELTFKFDIEIKKPIIYMLMLSNKLLLIAGYKFILIYKKKDDNYLIYQNISDLDISEIIKIKELNSGDFAICGNGGLVSFKHDNPRRKYLIDYKLDNNIVNDCGIIDFIKINEKENYYFLGGVNGIYIINDKKIINQIKFDGFNTKSIDVKNYICQFTNNIFISCAGRYITIYNISEHKNKQIKFLDENGGVNDNIFTSDKTSVYKYDINSIIILSKKGIFVAQIFNNDEIQINLRINLDDNSHINYLIYIEEEKSLYCKNVYKLKLNTKLK